MKQLLSFLLLFLAYPVFGQTSLKGAKLTSEILNKATSVTYYEDTGSLPPEYEYQYWITVKNKTVHFILKRAYGERTSYDKTMNISDTQYRNFVSKLAGQNIRNELSIGMPMTGLSNISIKVSNGNTVLFSGKADEGMVASKGEFKDAFISLLRANMKRELKKLNK